MAELKQLSVEVADIIKATSEYQLYRTLLNELKAQPELYNRVNEMREKNFRIQYRFSDDALEKVEALTYEYDDVINIELVGRFIDAEAALCKIVQGFYADIVSKLEFE